MVCVPVDRPFHCTPAPRQSRIASSPVATEARVYPQPQSFSSPLLKAVGRFAYLCRSLVETIRIAAIEELMRLTTQLNSTQLNFRQTPNNSKQEAQLSPSDRAMRRVS